MSYSVGTVVALTNGYHGTIKYIGKMRSRKGKWYGIKLTTPNGTNDGMDNGRYYFVCKEKYGVFVKKKHIEAVLSNRKSAKQSQKIQLLRSKSIHLFNSSTTLIDTVNDNKQELIEEYKGDNKYDEYDMNNNDILIDYESTLTHKFFRNCLSFLVLYLDNQTLYNLLGIEHFTSFYNIASFFNSAILEKRIINDPLLKSKYKSLKKNGINVSFWNLEQAFNNAKSNADLRNAKVKIRRQRFLVFISLQHMIYNKAKYEHYIYRNRVNRYHYNMWNGYHYGGYNSYNNAQRGNNKENTKCKIMRAHCRQLKDEFIKNYNNFSMVSNDLISVKYQSNSQYNGSTKIYKIFKAIFEHNNAFTLKQIAFLRGRKNVETLIEKLENLLIINVTDLLVKEWIILNTSNATCICGWISPKCVVTIFGGIRS